MAKGNESHITRIARTESHAEKVRLLFAQTVNKILALNKRMPELEKGIMYSFDGDTKKVQNQVDMLLRQLHSVATVAIENDIAVEWDIANKECDKLVASVFGKKALEGSSSYAGYIQRNKAALRAFTKRVEGGMNLSDRVWSSCRQLRDEMEIALTVAMGEGQSAQEISRSVRKYLNEPDLMFRRFRVKTGEEIIYDEVTGEEIGRKPIWGRKWKKRVKDAKTGKYKFIDYDRDSYIPKGAAREGIRGSQGVYKSSAKNAMRVARTETNMAYRMADHERWMQMDFVKGVHIEPTSHSAHGRVTDICDELQGDYPAWFVFEGWHPQCYCIATPILMSRSEMLAKAKAESEGKTYTFKEKRIEKLPDNFNDWVDKNAMKIVNSRDFGKDPYFVRHNWDAVNNIINPKAEPTTLEKAKIRHDNRTPEQIADIQARADERQKRLAAEQHKIEVINKGASNVLSVADSRGFTKLGIDISDLQDAVKAGNTANIQQETRKVAKAMAQKQKQIRKQVENIKKAASDWQEVDVSAVEGALASNNVFKMREQVKILAQDILSVRKQENALSDLIPNVHEWHKKFSLDDLQKVHDAVNNKMAFLAGKDIDKQIDIITKEIKYVSDPTFLKPHTLYNTWEVAQSAYNSKLVELNYQKAIIGVKNDINLIESWSSNHPKSHKVADLLAEAKHSLSANEDITIIQNKVKAAKDEYNKRLAEQARRNKKKAGVSNDDKLFAGGNPYTDTELKEKNRLEKKIVEAIMKDGDLDQVDNWDYESEMLKLMDKYYDKQTSRYTSEQNWDLVDTVKWYVGRQQKNPHFIWGATLGGSYNDNDYRYKILSYLSEVKNLDEDDLSIIQRFTNGSTFSNCYNLRKSSPFWRDKFKRKLKKLTFSEIKEQYEVIEEWSQSANYVLDKMKRYNGITFRGLNTGGDPELRKALTDCFNAGKAWVNEASCSTSTHFNIAKDFDDDLIMIIHNKTGAHIHNISEYDSEFEVMTLRGAKYKIITPPTEVNGRYFAELEEIID